MACDMLKTNDDIHITQKNEKFCTQSSIIERFDWFNERIQTCVAFGWLSERSGEKTSYPRTF